MVLLIIVTIGSIISVIFMPKRISLLEMYNTAFFATFLAAITDMYLDFKLNFYGFFTKGVNWSYLPIFVIVYPAAGILFLNFYPYHKPLINKMIYILACALLTTTLEYLALHTEVFYHNQWKLWYSVICYPIIFKILLLNLRFIRKLSKG